MADQDVLFRLSLFDDPANAQRLKALADATRGTMREMEQSVAQLGRSVESSIRNIGGSRISIPAPVSVSAATGAPSVTSIQSSYEMQLSRLATSTPENLARVGPEPAAVQRKAKSDAQAYKTSFAGSLEQMTGMSGDDLTVLTGGSEQRWRQLGKENGASYRQGIRDSMSQSLGLSDEQSAELFGSKGGAGLAGQQKEYKAESDRLMQSLTSNIEAWAKLDAAGQAASQSMGKNFRELAEKSEGFASGLGQIASGLAFLGAKNQNIKSLIDTLLTIKGVSDIGIGLVKSLSGVAQVISLVKERQQLGNQQTEIAAEKNRLARAAASDYVMLLQREGIELEKATQGNREHAAILARVAAEAHQAAAAEREHASAARTAANASGAAGRGRGARGFALGLGGILGAEAITSFGGGGLLSTLGGYGMDAAIGRLAMGGAGAAGAAGTGTAGAGAAGAGAAGAGAAGLATTVGAAVAALGALALVGVELKEVFSGTATKMGSVTDTIASFEVRIVDWVGDLTGLFDLIEDSDIDEKVKKFKEQQALKEIRDSAGDRDMALQMSARYEIADLKRNAEKELADIRSQFRRDPLPMRLEASNLRSAISGDEKLAALLSGNNTLAGQRQLSDLRLRQANNELQLSSVTAMADSAASVNAPSAQQDNARERLRIQRDLKVVMEDIARLDRSSATSEEQRKKAYEKALQLSEDLKTNMNEQGRLIQDQNEKRIAGNQAAIDGANRLADAFRLAGIAANDTLNTGAKRFARMSMADQAAAMRAQQLVDAGGAESLTDRQRNLLETIGTQSAVAAAEKADLAESKQRGYFDVFGKEERQIIEKAKEQERQARVEIVNRTEVNVELSAEAARIVDVVAKKVQAIMQPILAKIPDEVEARFRKERAENMRKANEDAMKLRNQMRNGG